MICFLAAHCTIDVSDPNDIRVLAGAHDFLNLQSSSGSGFYPVQTITNHPSYDSETIDYDYAILTLTQDLPFGYGINKICMPK